VLRWRQVSDYHCRSECGRYKVCWVSVDGVIYFEAWKGREMIGNGESGDSKAMREVCEVDANKQEVAA
jgi:hypothetical protein